MKSKNRILFVMMCVMFLTGKVGFANEGRYDLHVSINITKYSHDINKRIDEILESYEFPHKKLEYRKSQKKWLAIRDKHCSQNRYINNAKLKLDCYESIDFERLKYLKKISLRYISQTKNTEQLFDSNYIKTNFDIDQLIGTGSIAVSKQSGLLAVCGYEGTVSLYDITSGIKIRKIELKTKHSCRVVFNNSGTILFASSMITKGLDIIDVNKGVVLNSINDALGPVEITNHDNNIIIFISRTAHIYDYVDDVIKKTRLTIKGALKHLSFDKKNKILVALDSKGQVVVGKVKTYDDSIRITGISSKLMASNSDFKPLLSATSPKGKIITVSKSGAIYEVNPNNLTDNKRVKFLRWLRVDSFLSLGNNRYLISGYGRKEKSNLVYLFDLNKNELSDITRDSTGRTYLYKSDDLEFIFTVYQKRITLSKIEKISGRKVFDKDYFRTLKKGINKTGSDEYIVKAIGVYEGMYQKGVSHSRKHHPKGQVRVNIGRFKKPLVLVLSSCEPVEWYVNNRFKTKINKILLSGPAKSQVSPNLQFNTTRIERSCAYKKSSKGFTRLSGAVQEETGQILKSFQGLYKGESFNVGSDNSNGKVLPSNIYRWKDKNGVTHFGDRP